jgi:hypothetical protein
MTRSEAADLLERDREEHVAALRRYPLEIECGAPNTVEYWRAVIDTTQELDLLIAQLRATSVSPVEAINGSFIL